MDIEEAALLQLAMIGARTTLRYALQLLSPCSQLAKVYYSNITTKILDEVSELFSDCRQSAIILNQENSHYLK